MDCQEGTGGNLEEDQSGENARSIIKSIETKPSPPDVNLSQIKCGKRLEPPPILDETIPSANNRQETKITRTEFARHCQDDQEITQDAGINL